MFHFNFSIIFELVVSIFLVFCLRPLIIQRGMEVRENGHLRDGSTAGSKNTFIPTVHLP